MAVPAPAPHHMLAPRNAPARRALAVLACTAFAAGVYGLARVDAGVGRAHGPDRIFATVDPAAADAESKAHQVLRDRPVDGRAFRALAQARSAHGQGAQAQPLWRIAVARWPRDRIARAVLADQAFAAGDLDAGFDHLDALLRVDVGARSDVLALLMPHLDGQLLRDTFAARLATDPPWRSAVPAVLAADTTPPAAADALLAALARRTTLTDAELRTRVTLLDRLGQPVRARTLWLSTLAASDRGTDALVYDGGFERPHVSGGYGWQLDVQAGVSAGHDTVAPHGGTSSLAFDFDGRAVQFGGVRQALALAPGRHRLQAAARNRVDSPRPFVWRITCKGIGEPIAELPMTPAETWRRSAVDFEVPQACGSQSLQLLHLSRSMAERRLSGTLEVDDVGIFPGG